MKRCHLIIFFFGLLFVADTNALAEEVQSLTAEGPVIPIPKRMRNATIVKRATSDTSKSESEPTQDPPLEDSPEKSSASKTKK